MSRGWEKEIKNNINAKNTWSDAVRSHTQKFSPAHLLTFAPSLLHTTHYARPTLTHVALMHGDIVKHTNTTRTQPRAHSLFVFSPPLAQEKTLLARAVRRFPVHWPLVVNNDMTHPVERPLFCVSLMGADRRAWSPATWVSPRPRRRTADLSATASSPFCLLPFVTTVFLTPHFAKSN